MNPVYIIIICLLSNVAYGSATQSTRGRHKLRILTSTQLSKAERVLTNEADERNTYSKEADVTEFDKMYLKKDDGDPVNENLYAQDKHEEQLLVPSTVRALLLPQKPLSSVSIPHIPEDPPDANIKSIETRTKTTVKHKHKRRRRRMKKTAIVSSSENILSLLPLKTYTMRNSVKTPSVDIDGAYSDRAVQSSNSSIKAISGDTETSATTSASTIKKNTRTGFKNNIQASQNGKVQSSDTSLLTLPKSNEGNRERGETTPVSLKRNLPSPNTPPIHKASMGTTQTHIASVETTPTHKASVGTSTTHFTNFINSKGTSVRATKVHGQQSSKAYVRASPANNKLDSIRMGHRPNLQPMQTSNTKPGWKTKITMTPKEKDWTEQTTYKATNGKIGPLDSTINRQLSSTELLILDNHSTDSVSKTVKAVTVPLPSTRQTLMTPTESEISSDVEKMKRISMFYNDVKKYDKQTDFRNAMEMKELMETLYEDRFLETLWLIVLSVVVFSLIICLAIEHCRRNRTRKKVT